MAMNNPYAAYQRMANKYGAPKKKAPAPRTAEGQVPVATAIAPAGGAEVVEKEPAADSETVLWPARKAAPAGGVVKSATGTIPAAEPVDPVAGMDPGAGSISAADPAANPAPAPGSEQGGAGRRTVPFPLPQEAGRAGRQSPSLAPVNPYVEKAVMTASPQDLTLMLLNGAIKFMRQSVAGIQKKDIEKAHNANLRAQDIFIELMSTLNKDYEISNYLFSLYVFIFDSLSKANLKKDAEMIEEMIELTSEMRDTWREAMNSMQGGRLSGAGVSG